MYSTVTVRLSVNFCGSSDVFSIEYTPLGCAILFRLQINTCYTGMVERFGEYIAKQSVAVRSVPELIGGGGSEKLRVRFAYRWPDNVKMYK